MVSYPIMKEYLMTVYASADQLPALDAAWSDKLSAYRNSKCDRINSAEERARGRLAEYCLIAALLRRDPDTVLPLEIETDINGKPYLAGSDVHISLSHSGAYAAAAISDKPVGVDIERTRAVSDALVRRVFTERELKTVWEPQPTAKTFRDVFSAKESVVKRSGEGLKGLCAVDTTRERTIRQRRMEPYVLSVSSEENCIWEVFACEFDG